MLKKRRIRSYINDIKLELDDTTHINNSKAVAEKVINLPEYQAATTVFIFCSINKEIDTKWIVRDAFAKNKVVAFPKVDDNELIFHEVNTMDELSDGLFGVKEPSIFSPVRLYQPGDLIIVPGVAFDISLNRIGYGGGYYDKFFHKNPDAIKVAIAHDFQILDTLEMDDFDVKVDKLITEKRIIEAEK